MYFDALEKRSFAELYQVHAEDFYNFFVQDSSCYSCLRNYYNQKHHDELKRKYVIDFIGNVL